MHLYLLTLQRPTCIVQAIHGNFSGSKQQEIIVGRGRVLELLRPDPNTGKVHTQVSVDVFGEIRSLMPFRLTGGAKGMAYLYPDEHYMKCARVRRLRGSRERFRTYCYIGVQLC